MDPHRSQPLAVRAKGLLSELKWRLDHGNVAAVRLHTPAPLRATLDEAIAWLLEGIPAARFGDYLEFGCYNGQTMATTAEALAAQGLRTVRLVGFDSFKGLPAAAATEDKGVFYPGEWHCTAAVTRAVLAERGVDPGRVELVEGWFPDTLVPATAKRLKIERVSLAFFDWALGSGTAEALTFVEPFLQDRAAFVFPYWSKGELDAHGLGQKRAFETFLTRHPDYRAEVLPGFHDHVRVVRLER